MNAFTATIKINDEIHKIGSIYFDNDGNITKIITAPKEPFGEFWELEKRQIKEENICLLKKAILKE